MEPDGDGGGCARPVMGNNGVQRETTARPQAELGKGRHVKLHITTHRDNNYCFEYSNAFRLSI